MQLLDFLRELRERRKMLEQDIELEGVEDRLCEINDIIELLEERVGDVLLCQPKLNQMVLYLYSIECYSWKQIMIKYNIEEKDIEDIKNKFQVDLCKSKSDYGT